MSGRKRGKRCGENGGFVKFPKQVLRNPNFVKLSAYSNKLLLDLSEQYIGTNNGDLCATWSIMRERGWRSKETLDRCLKELRYYELIVQTQIGGLNRPSLYALAWFRIDKASKDSGFRVTQRVTGWQQEKRLFRKLNTEKRLARKKTQVRLSGQSPTAIGGVSKPRGAIQ